MWQDQFKHRNSERQKQADLLLSKWHQSTAARSKDMLTRPVDFRGFPLISVDSCGLEGVSRVAARYPDILESWQDRSKLTRAMANAISTGNWNIKRFRIDRAGVSQARWRLVKGPSLPPRCSRGSPTCPAWAP